MCVVYFYGRVCNQPAVVCHLHSCRCLLVAVLDDSFMGSLKMNASKFPTREEGILQDPARDALWQVCDQQRIGGVEHFQGSERGCIRTTCSIARVARTPLSLGRFAAAAATSTVGGTFAGASLLGGGRSPESRCFFGKHLSPSSALHCSHRCTGARGSLPSGMKWGWQPSLCYSKNSMALFLLLKSMNRTFLEPEVCL